VSNTKANVFNKLMGGSSSSGNNYMHEWLWNSRSTSLWFAISPVFRGEYSDHPMSDYFGWMRAFVKGAADIAKGDLR
jgi:hypothetical protein